MRNEKPGRYSLTLLLLAITFAEDENYYVGNNNIKCGDTCTFEIIAKNEILVTISNTAKTVEATDVNLDVNF